MVIINMNVLELFLMSDYCLKMSSNYDVCEYITTNSVL